jgi:hypothetical protein
MMTGFFRKPAVPPRRRPIHGPPADLKSRPLLDQEQYWLTRLQSVLNGDEFHLGEATYCRVELLAVAAKRRAVAEAAANELERQLRRIHRAFEAQDQPQLLARVREIPALLAKHQERDS